MKKVLLTACAVLAAMTASADVYTFIVDGADPIRLKKADKTHQTIIPLGYYGMKPLESKDNGDHVPTLCTPKALVSDAVMIEDMAAGNYSAYGSMHFNQNVPVKITPAAGLTITKIHIYGSVPNYCKKGNMAIVNMKENGTVDKVTAFTANEDTTTTLNDCSFSTPFYMACADYTKNYYMRALYIEFTVTGTSTQVKVPVCDKTLPIVAKNEKIALTCPTDGAKIYYTISYDGSTQMPTTASTLYTGPFTLDSDAIVRAIAVKDGMATSFPIYKEFCVVPNNLNIVASFDFTDFTSLKLENGNHIGADDLVGGYPSESTSTYAITNSNLADNKYLITGTGVVNTNVTVSNAYGQACELRTTKLNSGIKVIAPEGKTIRGLLIQGSWFAYNLEDGIAGNLSKNPVNAANMLYMAPEAGVSTVTLKNTINSSRYISRVYVLAEGGSSGVEGIEAKAIDENAPVEYYNLQGVRVANPTNGIFIKRQGSKASKIYVK